MSHGHFQSVTEYYFAALKSFSGNLLGIDHSEKENLHSLTLSYLLDYLHGTRGTYYQFLKDSKTLYNQKTIIYKNRRAVLDDNDDLLKFCDIDLTTDTRKIMLDTRSQVVMDLTNPDPSFHNPIDQKLGLKASHVMSFPIFFQGELFSVVEITRSEPEKPFTQEDQDFFEILMNNSASLIANINIYEWAIRDSLTNCYANTYFNKKFDEFITFNKRYGEDFTFVICDLDFFKRINDNYGHQSGDLAIKHFANVLKACQRTDLDILARYGGDEFCLLLRKCDQVGAQAFSQRVLDHLKEPGLILNGSPYQLSSSLGIAQFGIHGTNRETLFKNGDKALYDSKHAGKGCYSVYQAPIA